jgi:hypothetical protein
LLATLLATTWYGVDSPKEAFRLTLLDWCICRLACRRASSASFKCGWIHEANDQYGLCLLSLLCLMSILITDTAYIGPHAFLAKEAHKYETGVKTVLACAVTQVALAFCLRALLAWRNARRDREEAENPTLDAGVDGEMEIIDDITDFQNKKLRYGL